MSTSVLNLLTNSLNPSQLGNTQFEIERVRGTQGFAPELIFIADNKSLSIQIRQSALVVLKNMVFDELNRAGTINSNDYLMIKASVLPALYRQWGNKSLTLILRQIIHLIAEIDFPDRWPQIIPSIVENMALNDISTVAGSVEALKAIASVCGRSMEHEVTLSNLCNKTVIPLFELANRFFAEFSQDKLDILVSIFKIFHLLIFYHLPNIFINNMHSLMIFCKKILDLQVQQMTPLKVICLKILNRLYSRHTSDKISYKLLKFAEDFHNRYSTPFVQTFVMLLMDQNSSPQIVNLSLNCLTCIYKSHQKSAQIIDQHYQKLLELCIVRCKMSKGLRQGKSIGSFITHLKEERSFLTDFVCVLFNSNEKILADLIEYLNKGDEAMREVVLYIFSALAEDVEVCPQLHSSMSQFISIYILPILSGNNSTLLKARGCEIISSYKYVQIPQENLQQIFQFIYSCLTETKQPYLNIYALEAFTHLICKYDQFMKIIVPYLQDILKVYTSLMKESNGEIEEVVKSLQLFLGQIDGKDMQNCVSDLVKFLVGLFYEYTEQSNAYVNSNSNEDSEDEDEDENPNNAQSGCLACIREILSNETLPTQVYPQLINNEILPLAIFILSDKNLLHFEQCLNILNLCLYRSAQIPQNFDQFFKIFTYAIVGIPSQLPSLGLSAKYTDILQNVCVDTDDDLVANVIGFFRNFIAKGKGSLRNFKDEVGVSFMEYLFKMVELVTCSKKDQNEYKFKASDRLIILTIYTSLLQYQFISNAEFQLIVANILTWSSQEADSTNSYIEVLLVCLYYNVQTTLQKANIDWLAQELLNRENRFKYEYQLQRYILAVAKLCERQLLPNQFAGNIMKTLPNAVFKLGADRIAQQSQQKIEKPEIDLEQQAQQDLMAENTHLGTFQRQQQKQDQNLEEEQLDEEYNKFYFSPYLNINETEYLANVLKNCQYTGLLDGSEQEKLMQCICNIPAKTN